MSRMFFSQLRWRRSKQVKRTRGRRHSRSRALGLVSLGLERLEDRVMLSNDPGLIIHGQVPGEADEIVEGTQYEISFTFFHTLSAPVDHYTVDWKDGTVQDFFPVNPLDPAPNTTVPVTHTYAQAYRHDVNGSVIDNLYSITANVTLDDGPTTTTYQSGSVLVIQVDDVAFPTMSGATDVDEGAQYTLNLGVTDPGNEPGLAWVVAWDSTPDDILGGAEVFLGNPSSVTHVYGNGDATHTIRAFYAEQIGVAANSEAEVSSFQAEPLDGITVTVHNVAPTLTISGAANTNEGAVYTLGLSSFDPGQDTIASWTINWGDSVQTVIGNPSSVTHTYADGGNPFTSYTISAMATDEDGTFAAGNTVAVTVLNVAPTLTISGAANTNEGAVYTLGLSSFDPGQDTIASWKINWGDSVQTVTGNPSSVTHTYADGGNPFTSYTISAMATDEDGTYSSNTISVHVNNVAPTANAGGPYFTFDDTAITLIGTATDPAGALDPLTYSWDLDNNGSFETTGASVTFNPAALGFSGNQTRTVKLRVDDGDGGVTIATTTVQLQGQGTLLAGGVLYVVGSNTANDIVLVTRCNNQINVVATFNSNNPQSFNAASVTQIQIRTRGGNDIVIVGLEVTTPTVIDGGAGNDLLTAGGGDTVIFGGTGNDVIFGGPGNNILVGGDGNDIIYAAGGRDLIIGGRGSDVLRGGSGEDILIGGYTSWDNNTAALNAVMAIWSSSASFNARVAALTGSGGLLQSGVTVFDDDARDVMDGGSGRDLYFANINPHDHDMDLVALQQSLDVLIAVN